MRSLKKKGQAESIIIFFGVAVAILIASIIILRIVNSILTPLGGAIGSYNANAGSAVTAVQDKFTTWWDYFIVGLFLFNVIVLFISSFMVDINPAFAIIYIIAVICLFIFGNFALSALDSIWFNVGRASIEGSQTQLQQFIINNFQTIMLVIVILSGILMYAKFKIFGNPSGGGY